MWGIPYARRFVWVASRFMYFEGYRRGVAKRLWGEGAYVGEVGLFCLSIASAVYVARARPDMHFPYGPPIGRIRIPMRRYAFPVWAAHWTYSYPNASICISRMGRPLDVFVSQCVRYFFQAKAAY